MGQQRISPWISRNLSYTPAPNLIVLELPDAVAMKLAIPLVFGPDSSDEVPPTALDASFATFVYWIAMATESASCSYLPAFLAGALCENGALRLVRQIDRARAMKFELVRLPNSRMALVADLALARRLRRVPLTYGFSYQLTAMKSTWSNEKLASEAAVEAKIPAGTTYRAVERLAMANQAEHNLVADWIPEVTATLPQGVIVKERNLLRRLHRAIAANNGVEFARHIEAYLCGLDLEPAADGCYAVRLATCGRTQQRVMLIEFTARAAHVSIHDIIDATKFFVPTAFQNPLRSDWEPPTHLGEPSGLFGQFSGQPVRGGSLPRIDTREEGDFNLARRLEHALGSDEGLDPERQAEVRKAVSLAGIDALAWHQGFHTWDDSSWGIYFDVAKITPFVQMLRQSLQHAGCGPSALAATHVMLQLLFGHELFHARVEALGAVHELETRRPCLRRYRERVYRPRFATRDCLEEGLANFAAFQYAAAAIESVCTMTGGSVSVRDAMSHFVEEFLDLSPPGYNRWRIGHGASAAELLAAQLRTGQLHPGLVPPLGGGFSSLPFEFRDDDVPLYFVGTSALFDALPSPPPYAAAFVDDDEKRFQKSLARVPAHVQVEWDEVKRGLLLGQLTPGRDFKLWERRAQGSVYSVRLDRNFRAHLESVERERGWRALDVGSHKAMGHG